MVCKPCHDRLMLGSLGQRGEFPPCPFCRAPATAFSPLAVVAIGAWGTVHPSTVNALVRLGVQPDRVTALLRNAVKIVANHAAIIARARFAAHTRGVPTAV